MTPDIAICLIIVVCAVALFAWDRIPSDVVAEAEQMAIKLTELRPNERWQIRICTPARQGASWRWIEN